MADPSTWLPLTRDSVISAHATIKPFIHCTPVMTNSSIDAFASRARTADELKGTRWEGRPNAAQPRFRFWFKCENLQRIGAFKARGAFHAIERLKLDSSWVKNGGPAKGVMTTSAGNHGQALSLAAKVNGYPCHVVMPFTCAKVKVEATRGYGAHVSFCVPKQPERQEAVDAVMATTGARFVPSYNHPDILLGQGTAVLELQEQVQQMKAAQGAARTPSLTALGNNGRTAPLDAVIMPCGGGGLISGVALGCDGTGIRVFGAEPSFQDADDVTRGFAAGRRVEEVPATLTIADGLRTTMGEIPWQICYDRGLVKGMYAVGEDEILATTRLVFERAKLVVEPSGVVGLAVALFNEDFRQMVEQEAGESGWNLGVILSGGNIDPEVYETLFPKTA